MSLIILSNSQDGYSETINGEPDQGDIQGLQQPFKFHNALSNTITIPPKSEVGVVSTKIFRKPSMFNITRMSAFYSYFGDFLDATQTLQDSKVQFPLPVVIPSGYYTHAEMNKQLASSLTAAYGTHPQLWYFGAAVYDSSSVALPAVTGGRNYEIKQTTRASVIPGTATVVQNDLQVYAAAGGDIDFIQQGSAYDDDIANLIYTPGDGVIKRSRAGVADPFGGVAQLTTAPFACSGNLAAGRGAFICDVNDAGFGSGQGGWTVGLSRPEVRDADGMPSVPEYFVQPEGDDGDFYDYAIQFDQTANKLRAWHSIVDDNGLFRMVEITYWGSEGGDVPATQYDIGHFAAGGGTSQFLHWTVTGEGMRVFLASDAVGSDPLVIMDSTVPAIQLLGLGRCWKPVSQNCWALYPKFCIETFDKEIVLRRYEIPMPTASIGANGYLYPDSADIDGNYPNVVPNGGSSFAGTALFDAEYRSLRTAIDMTFDRLTGTGAQTVNYVRHDGSTAGGGATIDNEAIAYEYAFILNPEDKYPVAGPSGYYNAGGTGNCRGFLGFDADTVPGNIFSYAGPNYQGRLSDTGGGDINGTSNGLWTVNSTNSTTPIPKQLFIKSGTLTHQSYNFCKGLPSKILWSVPRFSNSGQSSGPLFFQQDSPIYLALNNASPVVINDIDIEFVDKDEKVVEDLGGETVVVLHIREQRRQ